MDAKIHVNEKDLTSRMDPGDDMQDTDANNDPIHIEHISILSSANGKNVDPMNAVSSNEKDGRNQEIFMSKFSIWKNHIIVCFAIMLLFTSHASFEILQSTLNSTDSVGTTGLTLLYLTFAGSSLFVVVFTTSRISNKRTLVVSMVTYMLYICTGFYSSWATVIPAAIVIGIGAGHLWVVQQKYTTALARRYAFVTKTKFTDANHLFFGVFSGFTALKLIWGNLISSLVLHVEETSSTDTTGSCGADFCPRDINNNTPVNPPTPQTLYTYVGILVGFDCLAIAITALFLTDVSEKLAHKPTVIATVKAVIWHIHTSRTQKLLIITSIYSGMQISFLLGQFNMAFLSCPYGIDSVGFVTIAFGVTSSLVSFLVGKIASHTGLLFLFTVAFCTQGSVAFTMLFWGQADRLEITLLLVTLWGVGDAVYTPITMSLYSILFQDDNRSAAFSSFRLFNALGSAISFAMASFLCMKPAIILMLVTMTTSFVLMIVLHLKIRKKFAL